jgi:hypothetical protein
MLSIVFAPVENKRKKIMLAEKNFFNFWKTIANKYFMLSRNRKTVFDNLFPPSRENNKRPGICGRSGSFAFRIKDAGKPDNQSFRTLPENKIA